jgi:hypothetical protein
MKDILAIAVRAAIAVKETNPIPFFKIWHSMMKSPDVNSHLMQALHTEFKDDVAELFLKTIQDPNDNRFQGLEDYDLSDPATLLDQVFQDIGQSK